MPPFFLQVICDLHTGTTARVRTSQGMSDVFYILGLWHWLRWLLLPRDTQTPGHRWLHYGSTWQSLASAKTQSLHQAQNIHLSCAVGSVIWFWNVDNAQSRQWQDPGFSHAGTASYPWYQMVWQGIQRSSQWEIETTRHCVSYCWQTSFIIWTHLSRTGEHTCFAGTATVNRSPHRHSSRCWLEAPAGSSTEKLLLLLKM